MNNSRKSLREHCEWMCNRYKNHPESGIYTEHRAVLDLLDKTEWIPVSEKLPEEATLVLVTCQDLYLHRLNPCIGWRNGQHWSTFCAKGDTLIQYPIAWQPLPEPYKAEREG